METPITIGPISLPTPVIVAMIAAVASIIGAGISFWGLISNTRLATRKNKELEIHKNVLAGQLETRKKELNTELEGRKSELARDLETYKNTLTEQQQERNAWRDYQYDARKNLYREYEPLLFQLVELSESALDRIGNLAAMARRGNLEPGLGWLSQQGEYYLRTTMYRLISPLAIVRLIQRRLTLVDLTVDNLINSQYHLAKYLYHSFSEDFGFARREPALEYDPELQYNPYAQVDPQKYGSCPLLVISSTRSTSDPNRDELIVKWMSVGKGSILLIALDNTP